MTRRIPTVYMASKSKHNVRWRKLRDDLRGRVDIISSWINIEDVDNEPPETDVAWWTDLWIKNAAEAAAADVVLLVSEAAETQRGALVEAGVAIGAGHGRVFVVNPYGQRLSDFIFHPAVTSFDTLEDALQAVMKLKLKPAEVVSIRPSRSVPVTRTKARATRTTTTKRAA